jgi:hypothetical protein
MDPSEVLGVVTSILSTVRFVDWVQAKIQNRKKHNVQTLNQVFGQLIERTKVVRSEIQSQNFSTLEEHVDELNRLHGDLAKVLTDMNIPIGPPISASPPPPFSSEHPRLKKKTRRRPQPKEESQPYQRSLPPQGYTYQPPPDPWVLTVDRLDYLIRDLESVSKRL